MSRPMIIAGSAQDCARAAGLCEALKLGAIVHEVPETEAGDAEELVSAAASARARGIFPASVAAYVPAAKAAAALRLPGPCLDWLDPGAALCWREALAASGAPAVPFRVLDAEAGAAAAAEAAAALGGDITVRTGEAFGHPLAIAAAEPEDLPLALAKAGRRGAGRGLLFEARVAGARFRLLGLKLGREFLPVEIFSEELPEAPHAAPMGAALPCGLGGRDYGALLRLASGAAGLIPPGTGLLEVSFVMTGAGPLVAGLHVPAGVCPLLGAALDAAYGVNLERALLEALAGARPRLGPVREMGAAGYWISAAPGIVRGIEGESAARALPGVCALHVAARPGDVIGHRMNQEARGAVGYAAARAATRAAAIEAARTACETIRINTSPVRD